MKIAVTGARGFVGRHVVAELARRSLPGTLMVRPAAMGEQAPWHHTVVVMDLHNPPPNAYEVLGHPDVLIHLAWGGLPHYRSLHHFTQELPAQFHFLQGLIASGLQSLVVAGTCFEYGMQSGCLSENLIPQPNNPYGFAKNALRCQLEYLQKVQPFNLTWGRLFYLFGEGQAANSLLPQLKRAIEQKERLFNMSGGEQLRDYLSVQQVAQYLVEIALVPQNHGIVNLCSGQPISVRRLVEGWIAENSWSIDLNLGYYPYPDYEPFAFWGDCQKLKTMV